jgi:hypothetical protein
MIEKEKLDSLFQECKRRRMLRLRTREKNMWNCKELFSVKHIIKSELWRELTKKEKSQ